MCSLEKRRARGDMIAVFNYLKGRGIEEGGSLFTEALKSRTRSNGFKLQERRLHLNSRKHFLILRAIHKWNLLPWRVVESPLLGVFKMRLDEHLSGVSDFKSLRRWGAGLDGPLWFLSAL